MRAAGQLFAEHCASCHGAEGRGGTGPSLRAPLSRGNTSKEVTAVIKNGVPGTLMPPSGLPDTQNRQLAQYVLGLRKGKPKK